ncbi:MAG: hypothetical protein HC772_12345 [Leptolyngbyaceae cyanobacterium CRU_2_3]|nr:hypothetical protein [Leptolyngbyaceae cyanobacterium CRU_2_3]
MNQHIRKAQLPDVAGLTELLKSLGWFAHLASESSEMTCERIAHHLTLCHADQSHTIYVAEVDSRIVGYIAVHWLPYLFSLPQKVMFLNSLFMNLSGGKELALNS